MKNSLVVLAIFLLSSCFFCTAAQTPPAETHTPPKALLILREEIKPGLMPAHTRHSEAYANMFAKLGTPNHRLAMTSVAGDENEVIYLTAADSFGELEQTLNSTNKKMESVPVSLKSEYDRLQKEQPDLHAGMHYMLAVYRPELSFNPGAQIAQMRYFAVSTTHVRPGHDAQYAEYVQNVLNVARKAAKLPDTFHVACFQVISGAPGGTYLFFRPMKSLGEFDTAIATTVRNAMSDDMKKAADKAASEAILNSESSVSTFQPKMSYMPKEFTSADAEFWTPAPAEMPKGKKKVARVTSSSQVSAARQ